MNVTWAIRVDGPEGGIGVNVTVKSPQGTVQPFEMLRPTGPIVKSAAFVPAITAPETVSGADPAAVFANLMVPGTAAVPTAVEGKVSVPLGGRSNDAVGGVGTGAALQAGAAGATMRAFSAVSVHVVCKFVNTTLRVNGCSMVPASPPDVTHAAVGNVNPFGTTIV